ncbi:MAG: InlB B-repeat-containing protein [Corallococcus sp.]|nr:InlB B-repeat-containing protein [Corallococcus sp.]
MTRKFKLLLTLMAVVCLLTSLFAAGLTASAADGEFEYKDIKAAKLEASDKQVLLVFQYQSKYWAITAPTSGTSLTRTEVQIADGKVTTAVTDYMLWTIQSGIEIVSVGRSGYKIGRGGALSTSPSGTWSNYLTLTFNDDNWTSYYLTVSGKGYSYSATTEGVTVALYAKSAKLANAVTISFDKNADGATGSMGDVEVESGSVYELPECKFTYSKYLFAGWKVNGEDKQVGDQITVTENTVLSAIWSENFYTVTLKMDGREDKVFTVEKGRSFSPLRDNEEHWKGSTPEGKAFSHWSDGTNQIENTYSFTPASDVTLTAVFVAGAKVTFDLNGGSSSYYKPVSYAQGSSQQIPNDGLSKTSSVFLGFKLQGDDSGKLYQKGEAYTVATEDMVFVAQWQYNGYTLTFMVNGEEYAVKQVAGYDSSSIDFTFASNGVAMPVEECPQGMEFLSWATDSVTVIGGKEKFTVSGGAANYSEHKITLPKKSETDRNLNIVLNAKFRTKAETFEIKYRLEDAEDGVYFYTETKNASAGSTETSLWLSGSSRQGTIPEGKAFSHWTANIADSKGNTSFKTGEYYYFAVDGIPNTEPLVLTAHYVDGIKVTFDFNGGSSTSANYNNAYWAPNSENHVYNSSITAPSADYAFAGWLWENAPEGKEGPYAVKSSQKVAVGEDVQEIRFVAQWKFSGFILTFMVGDEVYATKNVAKTSSQQNWYFTSNGVSNPEGASNQIFDKWTTTDKYNSSTAYSVSSSGYIILPAQSSVTNFEVTLSAVFAEAHTATLIVDGAEWKTVKAKVNASFPSVTAPAIDGKKFDKWVAEDGTEKNSVSDFKATADIVLTARYKNLKTMTFIKADGSEYKLQTADDAWRFSDSTTYCGTAPTGQGLVYYQDDLGNKFYNGAEGYTVRDGAVLTAVFADAITVRFELNGGHTSSSTTKYDDKQFAIGSVQLFSSNYPLYNDAAETNSYVGMKTASGAIVRPGAYYVVEPDTVGGSTMTLTAFWPSNEYIITFDFGGKTVEKSVSKTDSTFVIDDMDIDVPQKKGFIFTGYTLGGSAVDASQPITATDDMTFVATYQEHKFTVTLHFGGQTAVVQVAAYDELSLGSTSGSDLFKQHFDWDNDTMTWHGWYLDAAFDASASNFEKITADTDLYASVGVKYTVRFVFGILEIADTTREGAVGGTVNVPYETPSAADEAGYTLVGWSTTANGAAEFTADPKTTVDGTHKTLYAVWEYKYYNITFVFDGEDDVVIKKLKTSSDYSLENLLKGNARFEREGYTLVIKDSANEEVRLEGTQRNDGDKTFYVSWTVKLYTITFDVTGGSAVESMQVAFGATITPPQSPTKAGWEFLYWANAQGGEYTFGTMPAQNFTLTARWTKKKVTITFDTAGGNTIASIVGEYESPLNKPANPTKYGYTFAGWTLDGEPYELGETFPAENITLVAAWTGIERTITYTVNGVQKTFTANIGAPITLERPSAKIGYVFDGWTLDGQKFTATTMPEEDITLEEKWSVDYDGFDKAVTDITTASTMELRFAAAAKAAAILENLTDSDKATISQTSMDKYSAAIAAYNSLAASGANDIASAEGIASAVVGKSIAGAVAAAMAAVALVALLKRRYL